MNILPKELEHFTKESIVYKYRSPLFYTLNRCGSSGVRQDFTIDRDNKYPYCTMHLVTKGSGILIMNGIEYVLKSGDLFIIEAKQAHVYSSNNTNPLNMMWIEFYGNNSSELISSLLTPEKRVFNVNEQNNIFLDFIGLIIYIQKNDDVNPFIVSKLLYSLICDVLDGLSTQMDITKDYPDWLQSSIDYIAQNFKNKISVSEIASYIGYSYEHFSRIFSKYMGVSVGYYITLLKIEYSISLLKDDDLSIKDISQVLCFSDSTHFIKTFKGILGITPSKYRDFFLR